MLRTVCRSSNAAAWEAVAMSKHRVKPNYRRRVLRLPDLDHCKLAVLNSLGSPASRRVYEYAIDQFIAWYCSEPRLAFNRIVVVRYRMHLESRGLAANTINQQLAAVRRLAHEAADAGLLSPELAAGISRVKGVKQLGFRSGNWLSAAQSSEVLQRADGESMRAKRDYAMLAMLFGCGFRRSELVGLELEEIQIRQGHWAVVDLIGKGGHIRTVPIPQWVKAALDQWTAAARVTEGRIFRAVVRTGKVWGKGFRRTWCGMSSRAAASVRGWSTLRRTICAEPARGSATSAGESWNRFNSCWAMLRCRRPNVTSAANRISGTRSMIFLPSEQRQERTCANARHEMNVLLRQ
jgi:integrase